MSRAPEPPGVRRRTATLLRSEAVSGRVPATGESRCSSQAGVDRQLLARIGWGDKEALNLLVDRYWREVATYATGLLGSAAGGEDVAQEVFVRVWERRESWGTQGSVRALL